MRDSQGAAMKLSELACKVSTQQRSAEAQEDLSPAQIETILSVAFEAVAQTMLEDGSVYVPGFGTFSPRKIPARHSPVRAGAPAMWVPSHKVPSYRPSQSLSTRFKT